MRLSLLVAVLFSIALGVPPPALAWGAAGHRIINNVAARSLPASVPAFVRSPATIAEIATLGPEADRLKGAGKTWDGDLDPGHYLDLDDDGTIAGVLPLAQLPPTREAYDTAIRKGRVVNGEAPDEYSIGYVPYSIVEGWQQVAKDFAIWRVDAYGETHAATDAARAFFGTDRKLREVLTLRDIGYFGHFVADSSQPLHVTVHFNGWGQYPNPQNHTQSNKIHAKFETGFVETHATADTVLARIGPYVPSTVPIMTRVETYLAATNSNVAAVYTFEDAGAFDAGTPDAVNFMLDRLAAGGKMLRDLIVDAYAASADEKVGYPGITVRDVESGAVIPTPKSANGGCPPSLFPVRLLGGARLQFRDDARIGERRRVAENPAFGDIAQEPAHDLAAARLRQLLRERQIFRMDELSELFRDVRA